VVISTIIIVIVGQRMNEMPENSFTKDVATTNSQEKGFPSRRKRINFVDINKHALTVS